MLISSVCLQTTFSSSFVKSKLLSSVVAKNLQQNLLLGKKVILLLWAHTLKQNNVGETLTQNPPDEWIIGTRMSKILCTQTLLKRNFDTSSSRNTSAHLCCTSTQWKGRIAAVQLHYASWSCWFKISTHEEVLKRHLTDESRILQSSECAQNKPHRFPVSFWTLSPAVSRYYTNAEIIQRFIYEVTGEYKSMNPWTLQEHIRTRSVILYSTWVQPVPPLKASAVCFVITTAASIRLLLMSAVLKWLWKPNYTASSVLLRF